MRCETPSNRYTGHWPTADAVVCATPQPDDDVPAHTVQAALRQHLEAAWPRLGVLDTHTVRVLHRLRDCKTQAMGVHRHRCMACGWRGVVANRCGDRHCAGCSGTVARAWETTQAQRMLDIAHFQVVFTLPSELRAFARLRPRWMYACLMRCAAHVLMSQAHEHWDAVPGITAVLHTWNTELLHHPHVHLLLTAGGLRDDGAWHGARADYLWPTKVLGARFRGIVLKHLIDARDNGVLQLDDEQHRVLRDAVHDVAKRHARWVVHVEPPKGRPVHAVRRYLARYVGRVALTDDRVVNVADETVTFRTRTGQKTLSGVEFVRRFVQHILPSGFHRVRHSGLYAPAAAKRLQVARNALIATGQMSQPPEEEPEQEREPLACPECGSHRIVVLYGMLLPRGWGADGAPVGARGPP